MERLTTKKCGYLLIKYNDREYRSHCFVCESINKCNSEKVKCGFYKALEKLAEYEDLEERGQILIVPQIKKNKTLYWIWGDEIMPVLFKRITSCVVDNMGNPHVMCEMTTKKSRTFIQTYKRKPVEHTFKAGDKRYFYSEDIGKIIFFTREEAEAALKELKEG